MTNPKDKAKPRGHCHIQMRRLLQFFRAIERWAIRGRACYPVDFFAEEEFSSIASCDYCTQAVLVTFNLAGECYEEEVENTLRFILDIDHPNFGEREERERRLYIC